VMALIAMEQPLSFEAEHIRAEKLKVLQAVRPLVRDNLAVGQYSGTDSKLGYLDDPSLQNKVHSPHVTSPHPAPRRTPSPFAPSRPHALTLPSRPAPSRTAAQRPLLPPCCTCTTRGGTASLSCSRRGGHTHRTCCAHAHAHMHMRTCTCICTCTCSGTCTAHARHIMHALSHGVSQAGKGVHSGGVLRGCTKGVF
jgi:hypothetical protein